MQLAAQAQEHLPGFVELLQVDRGQEARGRESRRSHAVPGRAGDPDAALHVAQGADAVLQVRLLQVGAAAGLLAALALRLDDGARERPPGLAREERGGLGLELGVEFRRPAQAAGLKGATCRCRSSLA